MKSITRNKFSVTVVTVVFNFKDEIENTLLSVVNQSYENIEYIIIDGGSVDGTLDIIKKYQHKIKICISEPDMGVYDAMNKSLKIATGDFLIFMNAGDVFCSSDTITNVMENVVHSDAVYYGNAIYSNKKANSQMHRGGIFTKYRLAKTNICHQTIFYPRAAYLKTEYDLKYKLYSDWDYNIKLFSKLKFRFIDQDIAVYDHTGLTATNEDQLFKKDRLKIVNKYLGIDAILYLTINKLRKFNFLGFSTKHEVQ
ncbi:MAG: glycosyltransferase family 2 protein [Mucilaginibacter sp.]